MDNILGVRVHIHPVALFSIVDSYERRMESEKRVIGSLLGFKVQTGLVEVLNSYAVPHNETAEEVAVDMDFDRDMIRLHQKARNESLVGWYSTFQASNLGKLPSPETMMHSVLIHDYYSRFNPHAIFITVDTSLRNSGMDIKAYLRSKVGVPGKTEGIIFTPIPCEVVYFEPERVGVKMLRSSLSTSMPVSVISEFTQVERAVETIDQLLTKVLSYIGDVQRGIIPANGVVGRLLMETISRVPQVEPSKYEAMLNSTMQDLLMVVYLADLTKTQVVLGERLCQLPS